MHGFEIFRNFLTSEGYPIIDDKETFFVFKSEGAAFLVFKNPSPYVQMAMPLNVGDHDRSQLLELCNDMNDDCLMMKFVTRTDHVLANFEFPIFEDTSTEFLESIMPTIDGATDEFLDKLSAL